jgi:universal stress protein E
MDGEGTVSSEDCPEFATVTFMKRPTYILAVLDGGPMDSSLVAKATVLAVKFDARLELFLCDAEHAYALKKEYEPSHNDEFRRTCMSQAIEYLAHVRSAAQLSDARVSVSAACESPLYEGVVHKVLQSRPDLVIKAASALRLPTRAVFDPNDWLLMRKCPATLMMTRGRAWRTLPAFAVAVDVSNEETVGLTGSILETAESLRAAHGGGLDVLYVERGDIDQDALEMRETALQKLVQACNVRGDEVYVLAGEPEQALPTFVAERDYDALVMGALTHRPGAVALVGSLTSKLVDSVDCDFVLVKPKPEE